MTPIKGRLGKNTTPTSRSPTKLNQDLQVDPRRRRSNFDASSRADFSYAPEEAEYPKCKLHSNEAAIYKKGPITRKFAQTFQILHKSALKMLAPFQENQKSNGRSPVAHFEEFVYSAQVTQPRSQISSGWIATKALAPGAQ